MDTNDSTDDTMMDTTEDINMLDLSTTTSQDDEEEDSTEPAPRRVKLAKTKSIHRPYMYSCKYSKGYSVRLLVCRENACHAK